jgi:hypothetical protein
MRVYGNYKTEKRNWIHERGMANGTEGLKKLIEYTKKIGFMEYEQKLQREEYKWTNGKHVN